METFWKHWDHLSLIQVQNYQNALGWCNFHLPFLSLKKCRQWFTNHIFYLQVPNLSFGLELSCSGPFTRHLFKIADYFTVLSLILSSTFQTPWKYFQVSQFTYIPSIKTLLRVNNLLATWKIIINTKWP